MGRLAISRSMSMVISERAHHTLRLTHWRYYFGTGNFLGASAVDNKNNYLHWKLTVWETLITKCRVETDEWMCPFRRVLILPLLLQGKMLTKAQDSTESCCQKSVCQQRDPQGGSLIPLRHSRFHLHPTPVSRYNCCKQLPGSLHSSMTSYHKLLWGDLPLWSAVFSFYGYITL